jgi:hypothetical protein
MGWSDRDPSIYRRERLRRPSDVSVSVAAESQLSPTAAEFHPRSQSAPELNADVDENEDVSTIVPQEPCIVSSTNYQPVSVSDEEL